MKNKIIFDQFDYPTKFGYEGEVSLSEWKGDTLVNCPTKEDVERQKERLAFDFWLCVDEDGREQIMTNSYGLPPVRSIAPSYEKTCTLSSMYDNLRAKYCGIWMLRYTNGMFTDAGPWANGPEVLSCTLPKGSIRRLIGRELTWKDGPVLLQREQFAKKKSWWRRMWEYVKNHLSKKRN